MKKISIALAGIFFTFIAPPIASAEHTRVTNPNTLGVEIFGRALLYSVYFDRVVNDELVAGFGFGSAQLEEAGPATPDESATMIPVYFNYYFAQEAGSVFVTAGATLVANSNDVENRESNYGGIVFASSALQPTFGAGYENRSDNGFLFRMTGYGIAAKDLKPWVGFSFGYSF